MLATLLTRRFPSDLNPKLDCSTLVTSYSKIDIDFYTKNKPPLLIAEDTRTFLFDREDDRSPGKVVH